MDKYELLSLLKILEFYFISYFSLFFFMEYVREVCDKDDLLDRLETETVALLSLSTNLIFS